MAKAWLKSKRKRRRSTNITIDSNKGNWIAALFGAAVLLIFESVLTAAEWGVAAVVIAPFVGGAVAILLVPAKRVNKVVAGSTGAMAGFVGWLVLVVIAYTSEYAPFGLNYTDLIIALGVLILLTIVGYFGGLLGKAVYKE